MLKFKGRIFERKSWNSVVNNNMPGNTQNIETRTDKELQLSGNWIKSNLLNRFNTKTSCNTITYLVINSS